MPFFFPEGAAQVLGGKFLLNLDWVVADHRYQTREATDPDHVEDLAGRLETVEEEERPIGFTEPIVIFWEGQTPYDNYPFLLVAGFHRRLAALSLGCNWLWADVRQGGEREAMLYALGSNSHHGKRPSNADKNKIVRAMLSDPDWAIWTDKAIAKHTGTHASFVGKLRRIMSEEGYEFPGTRITADGRVIEVKKPQSISEPESGDIPDGPPTIPSQPQYTIPAQSLEPTGRTQYKVFVPEVILETAKASAEVEQFDLVTQGLEGHGANYLRPDQIADAVIQANTVFLSSPGVLLDDHIIRLKTEFSVGNVGEAYLECRVSTEHESLEDLLEQVEAICFVSNRVSGRPGTVIGYWGNRVREFHQAFQEIGTVLVPVARSPFYE